MGKFGNLVKTKELEPDTRFGVYIPDEKEQERWDLEEGVYVFFSSNKEVTFPIQNSKSVVSAPLSRRITEALGHDSVTGRYSAVVSRVEGAPILLGHLMNNVGGKDEPVTLYHVYGAEDVESVTRTAFEAEME